MSGGRVELSGADVVRLVVALGRAEITPFTRSDWDGWSGATGEAHTVTFLPRDHLHFLKVLGAEHVYPEWVFVILDDVGVSWNISSPHNGYAWMAQVGLQGAYSDIPTPEQYTEHGGRGSMTGNSPAVEAILQKADRGSIMDLLVEHSQKFAALDASLTATAGTPAAKTLPVNAALAVMEQVDFSPYPGLYDQVPWSALEGAAAKEEKVSG